jgi:hypothetical protein
MPCFKTLRIEPLVNNSTTQKAGNGYPLRDDPPSVFLFTFFKFYGVIVSTLKGESMKRVTKKLKREYLREKLAHAAAWALKALTVIYNYQTAAEKACAHTGVDNNRGFTSTDAEFLTSLAQQYERRGSLSPKQMVYVFKRMPKYWRQILEVTDEGKLVECMHRDGVLSDKDVEGYKQQCFLRAL